ncbi:PKD domain-containing protein [bacterium SCSIO 12643]|nr:PKD domain-containing protein [bacterium SCSIO 12643]
MRKFNWVLMLLMMVGMTAIQSCEKEDPQPPSTNPPTNPNPNPAPLPEACWSAYAKITPTALKVEFTNCSFNAEKYIWDFGDGNTSTEESPIHYYEYYGYYTVKLTAINSDGVKDFFIATIGINIHPTKMIIQEIKVLKWPETNNGTSWDPLTTADMYPKLIKTVSQDEVYTSSKVVENVVQGTPAIFGTDSGLPTDTIPLNDACTLTFFDQDNNTPDQNMGSIQFLPKDYDKVATGKFTLQNGDWEVEVSFTF